MEDTKDIKMIYLWSNDRGIWGYCADSKDDEEEAARLDEIAPDLNGYSLVPCEKPKTDTICVWFCTGIGEIEDEWFKIMKTEEQ